MGEFSEFGYFCVEIEGLLSELFCKEGLEKRATLIVGKDSEDGFGRNAFTVRERMRMRGELLGGVCAAIGRDVEGGGLLTLPLARKIGPTSDC